ncbi:MFS transporter [Streptomyces sp. NPDC051322]|uniref:MFS transporter n=1 Tax=Streptomyces sp. NPDC051322 TaxID=3154645 RepID=UPI00344B091F
MADRDPDRSRSRPRPADAQPGTAGPDEGPSAGSRRVVLVVMCAGYFLVLLDVTIVNVALPHIAGALSTGGSGLQWVVDAYTVVLAAGMLSAGTVGDLYGHKRVVLAGLAVFGLASLGCGLAPGPGTLIAFRALQGVGAALLLPGTLAVITHTFPGKGEQARAIGLWAGIGSVALAAGPLLGGVLVQWLSWRAVFLLNVPIVVAALMTAGRVVRESREARGRRLDPPGMLLGAVALFAVTFAFIQAGRSGRGIAVDVAIGAAVVTPAAFVVTEHLREQPMLPLRYLRRPAFTTANAVAGVMNLGTLGALFVLTLYLQVVQHRSAIEAGAATIPLFLPLSVLAPFAGRLTARIGPRIPMAGGLFVSAAGLALLGVLHADSPYGELLPALLLWGIGLGLLTPAVVAAGMSAVPAEQAGLASAVNNTARQTGGAVGIAAFGALAGSTAHPPSFLTGMHQAAFVAVGLYLAAALATLAAIPRRGPSAG